MPNIQSAKKKVRKDVRKSATNLEYKKALRKMEKNPSKINTGAYSMIDKAAKRGIIHKNKAARMKSKFAKAGRGKK